MADDPDLSRAVARAAIPMSTPGYEAWVARLRAKAEPPLDDPRTLAVPADATVHLRRQDEDLGEQVRRLMAERDRLVEVATEWVPWTHRAGTPLELSSPYSLRPSWNDLATRLAAIQETAARWSRRAKEDPERWQGYGAAAYHLRRILDPAWTPDAPASPPSEPVAAQKPPAGGIGPTEAQRGAEGVADECPKSKRVDGPYHSTRFDGDDPYTVCVYCGQVRDALTGAIIREGER